MAIKLDVYLTRTQQTLKKWLQDNDVLTASDLASKCSYLGLACTSVDIALADKILKSLKEEVVQAVQAEQEVQEIKQEVQEEKQKSSKKKDILKTQNK